MQEVSLFIPCTVDLFLPHVGEATFNLLRRAGVKPIYHEEQTCCGQPALNSGYRKEARAAAKHFLQVFGNDEIGQPFGLLRMHGQVSLSRALRRRTRLAAPG